MENPPRFTRPTAELHAYVAEMLEMMRDGLDSVDPTDHRALRRFVHDMAVSTEAIADWV